MPPQDGDDETRNDGGGRGEHAPTLTAHGSAPTAAAGAGLPERIGNYRIVGMLGQGGMGVVYEAEQAAPRRLVALKVIRGGHVADDLRLRMFEREAATLARLDHPNIGHIYESGRTPDGHPFFAMELIRGVGFDAWLAARPATPDRAEIDRRLKLFRQVCDAVHYAHQRGVIHRDLKPGNLMVTEPEGSESQSVGASVRILDFGLARLAEGDGEGTQLTEIGDIKGTLPYMAPEQARGAVGEIDVRTDVYALGVILYELLTRQRPYVVDAGSLLSAVRIINEQSPRPLAEAWTSSARLDGDLATIVATALEKEPARRYSSAAAFGDDIERFLTHQPIQARPPSTMYQLRKLVARRKPLFATAAVAVVLLIASVITMGVLYARGVTAERAARREAETAKRTADFLTGLFEQADPRKTRGATMTAREVVDAGARRVRDDLTAEPALQGRMMHTLGRVYLSLGLNDEALAMTEEALKVRRASAAGDAEIAANLHQLAKTYDDMGRREESRQNFEGSLALYEKLGPAAALDRADTYTHFGEMLDHSGDHEAAGRNFDRARADLGAVRPADEARQLTLLIAEANRFVHIGRADTAVTVLDRALAMSRRLHGERHHVTANVLTNLSVAHGVQQQFDRAADYANQALEAQHAIYGENHPMTAKAYGNVAIGYAQLGKFAEARGFFEKANAALVAIHGPDHPEVAQGLMNLGLCKLQSGDARAALADLERAVALHEKVSDLSPSLSVALYHLASARMALGDVAGARRAMLRVVAMDGKMNGNDSGEVADDLEAMVEIERALGNTAEAGRLETRMNTIRTALAASAGAKP